MVILVQLVALAGFFHPETVLHPWKKDAAAIHTLRPTVLMTDEGVEWRRGDANMTVDEATPTARPGALGM